MKKRIEKIFGYMMNGLIPTCGAGFVVCLMALIITDAIFRTAVIAVISTTIVVGYILEKYKNYDIIKTTRIIN